MLKILALVSMLLGSTEPSHPMDWRYDARPLEEDETGQYLVFGSSGVSSGDFRLVLEGRYYPASEQMRFLVLQAGLASEAERWGGIDTIEFRVDAPAVLAPAYSGTLTLEQLTASSAVEVATMAAPQFDLPQDPLVCAHLDLTLNAEGRFPWTLQTCDMRFALRSR